MATWFEAHLLDIMNGVAIGALLFVLAAGLSLLFGVFRVLNLAHGALFFLGASMASRLTEGGATWRGFLLALVLAAAVGAAAGVVLGLCTRPLAGRPDLDQALLTLGLGLILAEATVAVFGDREHLVAVPAPLDASIQVLGHDYPVYRLVVALVGAALAVALHLAVERTHVGSLVRATADDRVGVEVLGYDTRVVLLAVCAFAAAMATTAGVLGGRVYSASPGVDRTALFLALVVVVIGGLGSVKGTFLAAMLVGQVESLGVALLPDQAAVLLFAAMAFVLVVRPSGLIVRDGGGA